MRLKNNTRTPDSMLLHVCGVIKAASEGVSHSPVTGKKINSAILPVPVLAGGNWNRKSNERRADNCFINILLPALHGSVVHDHRALDMTRTKCEIEQLGSRLSDLTTRSDRLAVRPDAAAAPAETSRLLRLPLKHLNMIKCVLSPMLSSDQQDLNVFLL